jgi:hypothetical protein
LSEETAIIIRIAADRTEEFEAMFAAEELPLWNEYTAAGLFLEASLTRVEGGSENPTGTYGGGPEDVQDYILHVVARDHEAHGQHDDDPRFAAFLKKAKELQPVKPLVFFGTPLHARRAPGGGGG